MLHPVIAESNFQGQLLVQTPHISLCPLLLNRLQTNKLFCLSCYGRCPLRTHILNILLLANVNYSGLPLRSECGGHGSARPEIRVDNPMKQMNWCLNLTSAESECGQLYNFSCQRSVWWICTVFFNLIYSRACSDNLAEEGSCKCAILNSSAVHSTVAFCSHLPISEGWLWFQITWRGCKVQFDSCYLVNNKLSQPLIE